MKTIPYLVVLHVVMPTTLAADAAGVPDTSEWTCKLCPFDEPSLAGEIRPQTIYVSDSSAKYGDYTGLDEDGAYLAVDGSGRWIAPSGWIIDGAAETLGLGSAAMDMTAARPGTLRLDLGFESLSRSLFDTARSPFGTAGGALTLPSGWVRGGSTGSMPQLASSLGARRLAYDIDTARIGGRWRFRPDWRASIAYRHSERQGTRALGASIINTTSQLPAPLDDAVDSLDAELLWRLPRGQLRLGFAGSFFSNKLLAITWDNPFNPPVVGATLGRLAYAPDNSFQQLQLNGVWQLSQTLQASATAAVGRMRQDDDFLPYTINTQIASTALPRASLDGLVDTRHYDVALRADLSGLGSFLEGGRATLRARRDERDNRTPIDSYAGIAGDSFATSARENRRYDFDREFVEATGDYDLRKLLRFIPSQQRLSVSGGWRRESMTRDFQEVGKTTEESGWGRVVYRPARWLQFSAKGGAANREIDRFDATLPLLTGQNPLLRKYHLADRERQFAEASFRFHPLDAWSLTLQASYATNDFIDTRIGLINSRDRGAYADTQWTVTDNTSVHARYGYDRMTGLQLGSQSLSTADWNSTTEDIFRSGGVGLRIANIAQRFDLEFDYSFANSRGSIVTDLGVPPIVPFPILATRMNGGALALSFRQSDALTIRAELRYEHYDVNDFTIDNVAPNTAPTYLSLGILAHDHDLEIALLSFRYRFGNIDSATTDSAEPQENSE